MSLEMVEKHQCQHQNPGQSGQKGGFLGEVVQRGDKEPKMASKTSQVLFAPPPSPSSGTCFGTSVKLLKNTVLSFALLALMGPVYIWIIIGFVGEVTCENDTYFVMAEFITINLGVFIIVLPFLVNNKLNRLTDS